MSRRVVALSAGLGFIWFGTSYPTWRLFGVDALLCSTVAALICWTTTAVTRILDELNPVFDPLDRITRQMTLKGVRMVAVLGVAVLCYGTIHGLNQTAFWVWILIYYLAALVLEAVTPATNDGLASDVSRRPLASSPRGEA